MSMPTSHEDNMRGLHERIPTGSGLNQDLYLRYILQYHFYLLEADRFCKVTIKSGSECFCFVGSLAKPREREDGAPVSLLLP